MRRRPSMSIIPDRAALSRDGAAVFLPSEIQGHAGGQEVQHPPDHGALQNPGEGEAVGLQLGAVDLRAGGDLLGGEDPVRLEVHHGEAALRLEAQVRHALEQDGAAVLGGPGVDLPGGDQEGEAVLPETAGAPADLLRQGGGQEPPEGGGVHGLRLLGSQELLLRQGGNLGGDVGVLEVQILKDQVGGGAPLGGGEAGLPPAEFGLGEGAEIGRVGGVLRDLLVQGAAL